MSKMADYGRRLMAKAKETGKPMRVSLLEATAIETAMTEDGIEVRYEWEAPAPEVRKARFEKLVKLMQEMPPISWDELIREHLPKDDRDPLLIELEQEFHRPHSFYGKE